MQHHDLETVAREVSQPVDALGLLSHALRQRIAHGEAGIILDEIEMSLVQLRRRLDSFFDVVRAQHFMVSLDPRPIPLMPIFQKLSLQASRMAHDNLVSLSVLATSARVVSDPEALEIILRNLLVNGVFFAPGGRVLLGCRMRGDLVEVQVWDNGIGILPENRELIFAPLQKVAEDGDDPVPRSELGLSVARDLAQGLGHRLDLSPGRSSGSVFSLILPRAVD